MRFLIIRKADEQTETGVLPTEAQIAAMMNYNEELVMAGVMLDGAGLHPSSRGARVSFRNGTPTITDGPFAETKELIAGFTMIQCRSYDEALEWLRRWPEPDVDLELRQVVESEEFGEAYTPELQAQEQRLRAATGQEV